MPTKDQFAFDAPTNNGFVHDPMMVLGCLQETTGARFVDEASSTSGIVEDGVDGGVRKHRVVHAGIA